MGDLKASMIVCQNCSKSTLQGEKCWNCGLPPAVAVTSGKGPTAMTLIGVGTSIMALANLMDSTGLTPDEATPVLKKIVNRLRPFGVESA